MKILVGYDGSEYSDAALNDLTLAGLPRDSDVLVVSVGDLLSGPPLSGTSAEIVSTRRLAASLKRAQTHGEQVIKEAEELAEKAAGRLRSEFPEWSITTEVVTGTPAWELIDAADRWRANLIVVGSQGRSAIGRFFLGSVSRRVVTDARCSVRVARSGHERPADAPPRLILGVDGSLAAEQAIFAVGQRVWPNGTEVRLIAVDDATPPVQIATRLPQAAEMINSYYHKKEGRVETMLEWATAELEAIGVKTSVSTHKGDPKDILPEQAREWKADSIFVGTRDLRSSFERLRLGSVSTAVMNSAHCSVEVVRSAEMEMG